MSVLALQLPSGVTPNIAENAASSAGIECLFEASPPCFLTGKQKLFLVFKGPMYRLVTAVGSLGSKQSLENCEIELQLPQRVMIPALPIRLKIIEEMTCARLRLLGECASVSFYRGRLAFALKVSGSLVSIALATREVLADLEETVVYCADGNTPQQSEGQGTNSTEGSGGGREARGQSPVQNELQEQGRVFNLLSQLAANNLLIWPPPVPAPTSNATPPMSAQSVLPVTNPVQGPRVPGQGDAVTRGHPVGGERVRLAEQQPSESRVVGMSPAPRSSSPAEGPFLSHPPPPLSLPSSSPETDTETQRGSQSQSRSPTDTQPLLPSPSMTGERGEAKITNRRIHATNSASPPTAPVFPLEAFCTTECGSALSVSCTHIGPGSGDERSHGAVGTREGGAEAVEDRAQRVGARSQTEGEHEGVAVLNVEVRVPLKYVPRLIGGRGACIREFRQRSGACLDFMSAIPFDPNFRILNIAGTEAEVEIARGLVRGKLALWGADRAGGGATECLDDARSVLLVPERLVGRMLGVKGDTVAQIERMSGATVSIQKRQPKAHQEETSGQRNTQEQMRKVLLTGPLESRREAERLLAQATQNNRPAIPQAGALSSSSSVSTHTQPLLRSPRTVEGLAPISGSRGGGVASSSLLPRSSTSYCFPASTSTSSAVVARNSYSNALPSVFTTATPSVPPGAEAGASMLPRMAPPPRPFCPLI
uniref:K Homology domain-containing protein n=1 Tax=Chromera velia CCMP2878 TaxID=1169474 RepID=A0A0G4GT72_9ALVE|eukprot:Cvel_5174.t1-p1 / transcript=Cvel_5174.t1 / gene=Cvel_5174 / organism=Chromera_velia_CCMP2878 / gene_product=hypothetical protein / transcript_product=hypothetical protein / location=Cvel_scaffold237:79187-82233(-) / protein_length=708 / sequence_SO=supercontig / SO=protein_coding / is_pseudo=false